MNAATAARIVDSQAQPDHLAEALRKLRSSDGSKNCHFLPLEREALSAHVLRLTHDANMRQYCQDKYIEVLRRGVNWVDVLEQIEGGGVMSDDSRWTVNDMQTVTFFQPLYELRSGLYKTCDEEIDFIVELVHEIKRLEGELIEAETLIQYVCGQSKESTINDLEAEYASRF